MRITEVRIRLVNNEAASAGPLLAFASIVVDNGLMVHDLKVINNSARGPFVSMPSRKLTDQCPHCHRRNEFQSRYCKHCGWRLEPRRAPRGSDGRSMLHADIVHPINQESHDEVHRAVLAEYRAEKDRAAQSGYIPRYGNLGDEDHGPDPRRQ